MSRRKSVNIIRDVGVDPLYGQSVIQKFINVVMVCGKKNTARRVVYGAIDIIASKFRNDKEAAIEIFKKAIQGCIPLVEVKARRVGGSVYQVPTEVTVLRGQAIAFRSIISSAKARPGENFSIRLAGEILEANEGRGGAMKSKLDKHKMAEANRAFSHLVW